MMATERRQRWYAVAHPTPEVFGEGKRPLDRVSVEVSSQEEGELLLASGVRLEPGLYAFTDAGGVGGAGIGVVLVDMGAAGTDPEPVWEKSTSIGEICGSGGSAGLTREELSEAFTRKKHIVGEMVALYLALERVADLPDTGRGRAVTVVHDYIGVCAWMRAATPSGASMEILPGFSDGAAIAATWGPTSDPALARIVAETWTLIIGSEVTVQFRHQPGHRSEAAGENHYVRFNKKADNLAREGSQG